MRPALKWRVARRLTQILAIVAVVVAPFLGGWQRLERNDLSSWHQPDRELPATLRERLPRGDTARDAYTFNALMGGGVGVEYLEVPTVDPVAGVLAMTVSAPTWRAVLALAIPVLIAMVAGRLFCGWFCPFGTLSRGLAWLTDFVPWRRRYEIPTRRPLRFVVLALGLLAGLLGANVALYLALPHLLVQQAAYASWLLGGGGAALGLLLGLIAAGLVVGPTTYCATLCPTGAALSLIGRRRLVRLQIVQPSDCGKACRRCSTSCWLQLDPASGDPGPDCDLCGRCEPQCPKTNLKIGIARSSKTTKAAAAGAVILIAALSAGSARAQSPVRRNPELVLGAETILDGVTVAVDVIDQTGVRLSPIGEENVLSGTDITIFLARGELGGIDERGLYPTRDTYDGPLSVHVFSGGEGFELRFPRANFPESTPRRTIFRRHIERRLVPGDVLAIQPVDGWLEEELRFRVPPSGVPSTPWTIASWALTGFALFGGLLLVSLSIGPNGRRRTPSVGA